MTKMINSLDGIDGMTIRDLISDEGFIMEIGHDQDSPTQEESYPYDPNAHLNNLEMIKMLNMDEFASDDGSNIIDTAEAMMPWSLSFEKIKAKSEDLTKDGKITKLVKREGVGERLPSNCLAIVHYGAYIEHQDEPFESTFRQGQPQRLQLGQGEILPGLDFALATMKKHEVAFFVIHHDYAYRELGSLPLVPPRAEILFVVHVVDFVDRGSVENDETLTAEQKKRFKNVKPRADALIKTGAESFKRHKARQAIREYSRATAMLESASLEDDEDEAEFKKMLSRAYGNLAVCYNKEDKPRMACKCCLSVPNPTAKTYFHHGRALIKIGEYKRALEELQRSLRLEPNNLTTIKEIQLANTLQIKFLDTEKRLWQNCLKAGSDEKAVDDYAAIAEEFCQTFANNKAILRQPLPEGLTPLEDQCIRQRAAKLGLTVIQQVRYGRDTSYLVKPNY